MDSTSRLTAIAWIYALIGSYALIEQLVSLFLPLDNPIANIYIIWPQANLAVLMLPIGIGLMRRSDLCRRLALAGGWTALGLLGVFLTIFGLLSLGGGEVEWVPPEDPMTGDAVARLIGTFVIGVPIFFWQLRQLHSKGIRDLTVAGKGPEIEQE